MGGAFLPVNGIGSAAHPNLSNVRFRPIAEIGPLVQIAGMILAFIFLAAAVPEVSEDAIRQQAARCGLSSSQLVWSVDAEGHRRADITPNGDLDSLAYKSLTCILDWAKQTGARVGWVSDPPPAADEIVTLGEASEKCGLPKGTLRFQRNGVGGYDIRIDRTQPVHEERIDCALERLPPDYMMKFGLGPLTMALSNSNPDD